MNTTTHAAAAAAPAYYLGRPATVWQTALRRRQRPVRTPARPPRPPRPPAGSPARRSTAMKVPFNVLDFLDRAEHVYGDRIGVVDEPDQPADSWGQMTWRQVAEHARAMAAGLDALGVGRGERVAIVSHNSARLLVALFAVSGYGRVVVPINFRLNADEVRYIVEQSGASVLLVDPELDEAARRRARAAPVRARPGVGRHAAAVRPPAEPVDRSERGRRGVDQLHERHDRSPQGRRADPPQPVRQRPHLRLAHRRQRPRRLPLGRADVPLQRLGHGRTRSPGWVAGTSCCARSTDRRSSGASTARTSRSWVVHQPS